ncbi:hypothetical protein C8R47DRAFT_1228440 [Mycena vitilis]|nr:hypothetical protein C8R47DRAFT_1228440 [Mycena vitilis]
MEENTCRDIVLYVPVLSDVIPPLISEQEFLKDVIKNVKLIHYESTRAVDIEHSNWLNWFLPGLESPCAPRVADTTPALRMAQEDWLSLSSKIPGPNSGTVSLQKGERYANQDALLSPHWWLQYPCLVIDSSFCLPCRCQCPGHWSSPTINDASNTDDDLALCESSDSETDSNQEMDQLAGDGDTDSMEGVETFHHSSDTSMCTSDDEFELVGRCDYCSLPLGSSEKGASRAYRCAECESMQCDSCCHTIHVCKPNHVLLEWHAGAGKWIETLLENTNLPSKFAVMCGVCDAIVAEPDHELPAGTILCEACTCGVLCVSCCLKKHVTEPLHEIKTWSQNGNRWKTSTLRQLGYVYQMGHGGKRCPLPDSVFT